MLRESPRGGRLVVTLPETALALDKELKSSYDLYQKRVVEKRQVGVKLGKARNSLLGAGLKDDQELAEALSAGETKTARKHTVKVEKEIQDLEHQLAAYEVLIEEAEQAFAAVVFAKQGELREKLAAKTLEAQQAYKDAVEQLRAARQEAHACRMLDAVFAMFPEFTWKPGILRPLKVLNDQIGFEIVTAALVEDAGWMKPVEQEQPKETFLVEDVSQLEVADA